MSKQLVLVTFAAATALTSVPALAQTAAVGSGGLSSNPKISLILQGTYADFSTDTEPEIAGVLLGPETELRPSGFSLAESEMVFESNVDDQWHGWATVALENEDGETVVALEEAYINSLALPGGFAIKAGRFLSELGHQNRVHSHAWNFADLPLPYRALLAGQLRDDGLQVRWVAPLDLFVELGAEALRGQGFPAGGEVRSGVNSWVGFARLGGDVGEGGAWQLGASQLRADADGRASDSYAFTGDSVVTVVDLVYKWAPGGNPTQTNVAFNAEFFHRAEDGTVGFDDGSTTEASGYDGTQRGYYAQAVWQFMPRWRVGVRHDGLRADNALDSASAAFDVLADEGSARRLSTMVDFSHSEFSRLRLQYNLDRSRPGGETDHQWFLQYVVSLGAHAAHSF